MTKDTFGESLKREREMRGVTLDEISAATRIATRFLTAIETEQWDQLPGGVFNRGFVRAVARYLGLDEENIVAEYTLAVGDRQTAVPVWTGSPPAVTPQQPWLAWIIACAVLLLLLAGGWFGTRRILAWRAARRVARAAATTGASATFSSPDSQQTSGAAAPSDNVGLAPRTSAGGSETTPPPPPVPPATDRFELKIEAGKKTKVTVTADDAVVFDGTMKAGEDQFFSAADHFQISARDAGALHLELNGKPIAPIGPSGQKGKVTLTRDTLKGAPGGGN